MTTATAREVLVKAFDDFGDPPSGYALMCADHAVQALTAAAQARAAQARAACEAADRKAAVERRAGQ